MTGEVDTGLTQRHRQALQRAALYLERPDFAARLGEYAGQPVSRVLRMMPGVATAGVNRLVEAVVLRSLNLAIRSLQSTPRRRPASRASTLLAGMSGGVSGFMGIAALPVELPLTTTLMLRSIAEIARHHGEDLSTLDSRLACVEVLGLGTPGRRRGDEFGYYATRALIGRLIGDASTHFVERGVATASAPVVSSLVAEIAPRFGLAVTERASASLLPVLGALGGATVNVLFMRHFQQVAHGHFTVRRLEREYGAALVRREYQDLATTLREIRGQEPARRVGASSAIAITAVARITRDRR